MIASPTYQIGLNAPLLNSKKAGVNNVFPSFFAFHLSIPDS
ncbi:conserved hypothetical protein [Pediococcus acidilactici NGRI 0510Q]|uniref:Uncharacterized protein n=1 Tax=Pediococcus acidilactici DSM 20284 TaxID=862514 RepID=E0NHU8_PEDAC|nr:hypothetical protein HMPREF0623_1864 [Pediococcus acidilactici DSM 20284]GAC46204.1 conserved hypothetical protein [Pediococcus acidilactici NGRI 0510Q]